MNTMPANPLISEHPSESSIASLSFMNKNKLDKAQAKRLKMPKRNRSAYFLFSMDIRAKLKAEKNKNLTPLETQALVSKYWKNLSFDEKEKYEQKAKEEKLEYLVAIDKFYSNLTPETIEKSKTNKPKKPCSAYAHFVRDIKTDLKKENPRLIMQEVLHIVSEKWKNLDDKTRAIYEEKARIDKEQYIAITRNLNSDSDSPKTRRRSYSDLIKLGKRTFKTEAFEDEQHTTKQIKTENVSVKSETAVDYERSFDTLTKIEEYKVVPKLALSPTIVRAEFENQQMTNKLKEAMALRSGPQLAHMNMNYLNERKPIFGMPSYAGYFAQGLPNESSMINFMHYNLQNEQQLQQAIIAKLSLSRMLQNHQDIEQTIMKKMMEIKTLQAQNMMVNRNFFPFPQNF